jgi:hypothetical protein
MCKDFTGMCHFFYSFLHLFTNINPIYRCAKKFQSCAYHIPDIFLIEPIEWGEYKDRIKDEILISPIFALIRAD